ncbi:ABC transporter substrate-binding protein [Phaeobacter sp. HF9A]|uniref:ABC transporter substrate-binding protein n=1 Tax=Phaeobacter sp. HF9A TaxID=2721561 RepID=UPI00142F52BC|nr:extracellular solute-binding protein [Phaeobacter sp. HF9A]NIZ12291.1 extracellular solute-binding protein [Phaeobacter sp. HF9A]
MKYLALAFATTATTALTAIGAHAQSAEVVHWWTSAAESAGVGVIAHAYDGLGGEWIDQAVAGSDAAKAAAISRMVGGNPPEAAQFSLGADIDNLVDSAVLAPLDQVATADHWADIMPAAVMDAVTRDGHVYGVPIQLQGTNFLFASRDALEKVGAEMPQTWDAFFATGDKLRDAGIIPFAQAGDRDVWFMNTFQAVLASVVGTEGWNEFTGPNGPEFVRTEAFRPVAEIMAKLPSYADVGVSGRQWNITNQMILNGEAGFFIMGGWAIGEIGAAGFTPGEEVLCGVGPNQGPLVVAGDIWAMPAKGDGLTEAQVKLAEVTTSVEVQAAFTAAMGSLPVRSGVDTSGFNACAAAGAASIAEGNSVMALFINFSPEKLGALGSELKVLWVNSDATADDYVETIAGVLENY